MHPSEWNIVDAEFSKQEHDWYAVVVVFNVKEQVVVQFIKELISCHFANIGANEPKVEPEKKSQSQFTEESPLEHEGCSLGEKAIIEQLKRSWFGSSWVSFKLNFLDVFFYRAQG